LAKENLSVCGKLMQGNGSKAKYIRAKMINHLTHSLHIFNVEDRTVFFTAVSMMDRYFNNEKSKLEENNFTMTAAVCLFMASKYLEIEAMVLGDCSEVFLLLPVSIS
jgi:Cyclin, N-terminal domain